MKYINEEVISPLQNLLGGALLGCWPLGFLLCCFLTAVGASNCFLLSRLVGANIVQAKFPTKIKWLQEKVIFTTHEKNGLVMVWGYCGLDG